MRRQVKLQAKKAITISRVSTLEQAADYRDSLPAQIRDNKEYCEDMGLEIIQEFSFSESAGKNKRRRFEKAKKLVEESDECIAVVVDRVDRFQRNFRDIVDFDDFREKGKVEIHFVRQNLIIHRNSRSFDLSVWHNSVVTAVNYIESLKENVTQSIREKLPTGRYLGYVPTGYKNVVTIIENNILVKTIELDDERSPFIRRLFHLYATGKYSLSGLAEIMENSGFTIKQKRFRNEDDKLEKRDARMANRTDIQKILKNPFYYGHFRWRNPDNKDERLLYDNKGTYPALIDKKLFDQVQIVMKNNNSRIAGFEKKVLKFRSLLKCQFCGSTMTGEDMSRNYKKNTEDMNTIYYHCTSGKSLASPGFYERKFGTDHSGVYISKSGKRKGQTIINCPQKWWKESEIEEIVLEEFDMIHYDKSVFKKLKKLLRNDYEERANLADAQMKSLNAEIKKNEAVIKAFMRKLVMMTDKQLEKDMIKSYNDLKARQDEIKEEIKILEEAKNIDMDETVDTLTLCCNLREHYLKLNLKEQQELLWLCFSKITLMRGEYRMKKGKGRKMNMDSWSPILNEPFQTLRSLKIHELLAQEEDKDIKLTKKSLSPKS